MKRIETLSFILLSIIFRSVVFGQPACHFEHYGSEEGLSQQTITNILQDQKGFMWFATWDGLCKFDGYEFKTYKTQPGDEYFMKNNRIDYLHEDKYGYIWIQSYDNEAHCFDPRTEKFTGVTQTIKQKNNLSFVTSEIMPMPSGKVWLLSRSTGCICIDSVQGKPYTATTVIYNAEKGNLKGKCVFSVIEDMQDNSWILSDNGLVMIPSGSQEPMISFAEKETGKKSGKQSFYCALELKNEIWFGSDEGRIWIYNKGNGQFNLFEIEKLARIVDIKILSDNKILILTREAGLAVYDMASGTVEYFNIQNLPLSGKGIIYSGFTDKSRNVWLQTDCPGVVKFNYETKHFNYFNVSAEDVNASVFAPNYFIFEDNADRLWVHPRGGGFSLYDPLNDTLLPFFNSASSQDWRFSNMLHSAYCDRQGNLWICTRSHGLEKIIFDNDYFKTMPVNPDLRSGITNDIRCVFEDSDNYLWVSTKDGYLRIYDSNRVFCGHLCENGTIGSGKPFEGVAYCMIEDKHGVLWIGTKGQGLFKAEKNTSGNMLSYRLTQYVTNPKDIYSLSDNSIYSVFEDKKGRIWLGSYGGGLNLAEISEDGKIRFINHRNNLKNYPIETGYRIRFMNDDNYGNLYIGTTVGMIVFASDFRSPESIVYKYYSRQPKDAESLSNNDVHCIFTTKKGDTYLATFGGGINKVTERDANGFPVKFRSYMMKNGLPSDVTLAILEDENEDLWISTENSLSKFDPKAESFETFGEIKRLIKNSSFSEASACLLSSGEIIFGYSKGLFSFFPKKIIKNTYVPYIALTDFQLFNKEVPIGNNSPLKREIDDMESLVLTHKQNFLSIEYAALDYVDPGNILYAYKLEGVDNDWIYAQRQRIANYTNLPKGKYVFCVKSTNSDGIWVDNERRLPIEILPSFWETPLAYLIYFFLLIGLIALSVYILFTIYRLKDNVKLEKKLAEMKLRFFTDISHEIRTPLTMITAPIEFMIQDKETPSGIKQQLKTISQNTNRLLRLVNQILDFRKIQHLKLKVQETELSPFIAEICENFQEIADEQNIQFLFKDEAPGERIWIDKDCVEKIVFNLLSNAFKFTPSGKSIEVIVSKEDNCVSVQVKDEGKGIVKEKQKTLFTRFDSFNEDKSKPSTGIGLSMVKDLSDKHHAKITAESETGKGSCFKVTFLKGFSHFDKNVDIIADSVNEGSIGNNNLVNISKNGPEQEVIHPASDQLANNEENALKRSSVLVVEDDDDLRNFLKTILNADYIVYEAVDGQDGYEKALKMLPEFIVSDIMMPNIDGIELLQKIKNNINTSHIPVVLLTAKTSIENKLEGLSFGADDYIVKPFSVPYFRARIANLLEQRRKLQQLYCSNLLSTSFTPSDPQITPQDESFMEKVIREIEAGMDNSESSIDDIVSAVGTSRTVFFKKIKSITGMAPVEFVRDLKIKRGAQLLATGQFSVKEASFMVGITDSKYFSKCFKKKYGINPAEYKIKALGMES